MANLTVYRNHLNSLRQQAKELSAVCLSLMDVFTTEENRLHRIDNVSRLNELRERITHQLEETRRAETSLQRGYDDAKAFESSVEHIAGVGIKLLSEDKQVQAFSDYLLTNTGGGKPPYGRVLIVIGPDGLPDDAHVVSISRVAREFNRTEFDVTNALRELGCHIFGEVVFLSLIEKMTGMVAGGQLSLPITTAKLTAFTSPTTIVLKGFKV